MKNFIRAFWDSPAIVAEAPKPRFKSIVEEIHHAFNNEIDNILAEANISKSLETINEELQKKAHSLRSLGFTNTKEVKDVEELIKKNQELQTINKDKQQMIKDIKYFQDKYPHYRIITKDAVDRICKKYGLVHAAVCFYTGTVPQKNLTELENFKIDNKDKAQIYRRRTNDSKELYARMEYVAQDKNDNDSIIAPLIIAAPYKDFEFEYYMRLEEGKMVFNRPIEDPIVMQPVAITDEKDKKRWYNDHREYYLIVTAWGDEASDAEVVHAKMN